MLRVKRKLNGFQRNVLNREKKGRTEVSLSLVDQYLYLYQVFGLSRGRNRETPVSRWVRTVKRKVFWQYKWVGSMGDGEDLVRETFKVVPVSLSTRRGVGVYLRVRV